LKNKHYFSCIENISFACVAALIALAVALMPSRAVARDDGAIVGAIVGVAAAAMIANGIANAHRTRPARVARHRKRGPTADVKQTARTGGDPFAGVSASKVRPVSGN
jgi:hypothetical protein